MMFAWSPAAMVIKDASSAMYENSNAFENFLGNRNVSETASSVGLQMKSTHTIAPRVRQILTLTSISLTSVQRHGVPLNSPRGTLPVFSNDEEWYQQVGLLTTRRLCTS
jgi:hypothetical protein